MGAIAVTINDIAEVNESICIGCGVCTPSCSNEAVDLVQRAQVKAPPDLGELMTKRFKEA